jgi:hypothetical protein
MAGTCRSACTCTARAANICAGVGVINVRGGIAIRRGIVRGIAGRIIRIWAWALPDAITTIRNHASAIRFMARSSPGDL